MKSLYEDQLYPLLDQGLSVAILTQLSDVEEETNGLVTYDRNVYKVPPEAMRRLNAGLTFGEDDD